MSALKDMKNALSRLKACRSLLRSAREGAKRVQLDHLVLRRMQSLFRELKDLEHLRDRLWEREVRRAAETLKHGTTGTGPARAATSRRREY